MAQATLTPGSAMTLARESQAAVRLADGRVLIMGGAVPYTGKCGMTCASPATASVEIYDPSTGMFSANGSLTQPRTGEQALLLHDGRVLVVGGGDAAEYGNDVTTVEIYDPAQGTSVAVKVSAGMVLPLMATVVLLANGRVLMAGGFNDRLKSTTSQRTLIFDPVSATFTNGPNMDVPRLGALATLLDDGRVLMAGGLANQGAGYYQNAELIDLSHPLP
jgi:hypothetical protein